jgi:HEPN domain-containing protein
MDDARSALLRAWMQKARSDLGTARKLATGPDAYLDTAIYHCQQAAEKAIKALLVQHDLRFQKTHDLELLMTLAAPVAPRFATMLDTADRLTPYAVAYRYPGEVLVPSDDEVSFALAAAKTILEYVESLLASV